MRMRLFEEFIYFSFLDKKSNQKNQGQKKWDLHEEINEPFSSGITNSDLRITPYINAAQSFLK
ncbi:MAG: hypothetical protein V4725_18550, partial [Bacteroidota bacterium]